MIGLWYSSFEYPGLAHPHAGGGGGLWNALIVIMRTLIGGVNG